MALTKPIYHKNFFVITGGPGVGKTTLLQELEKHGVAHVPEDARQLIKEQIHIDGMALPWKNKTLYAKLMLERSVKSYQKAAGQNGIAPLFFDRGIIDTLCYLHLIEAPIAQYMLNYAKNYRYNKKAFILPPWHEIYETDMERKQSWQEAVETYNMMTHVYQQYDYQLVEVPKTTTAERAQFILRVLS